MQAQLSEIQDLLAKYRGEWTNYDMAEDKSAAQKPTPPDFAALARKYDMSASQTGLISKYGLAETDLGKSTNRQQRMQVVDLMFGATTLYKPEVSDYGSSSDSDKTYFVFWKIEDQPEHVPKWEEPGIQDEVLRVWKFNEARKLALKRADELKAEAAAKTGQSLKKLAAGKSDFKVLRPLGFSFLTQDYYGKLQFGKVFGMEKVGPDFKQEAFSLEKVGRDFMQKVFALKADQVDVATDLPQTEIYVIRALEFTPFEELWKNFTSQADYWTLYNPNATPADVAGLLDLMTKDWDEVSQAWRSRLYADAGVKWEKTADQRSAPDQGPGPSPIDED